MAVSRITKASVFMGASWTGLAGMLMYIAAQVSSALADLEMLGILIFIAASLALLWARKADEYTQGLWNAGASTAFATMLVLAIGFSFGAGFVAGITDSDADNPVTADTVLSLEIAAFYVALFAKRLLGAG